MDGGNGMRLFSQAQLSDVSDEMPACPPAHLLLLGLFCVPPFYVCINEAQSDQTRQLFPVIRSLSVFSYKKKKKKT